MAAAGFPLVRHHPDPEILNLHVSFPCLPKIWFDIFVVFIKKKLSFFLWAHGIFQLNMQIIWMMLQKCQQGAILV